MAAIAPVAVGATVTAAGAAAITISVGYLAGWIAEKGVDYFYSSQGQEEAAEFSKNIMESLYNNPNGVDSVLVELAQENEEVAEILKREGLITDAQVGEYIKGERTDTPTNWLVTTTEYGLY